MIVLKIRGLRSRPKGMPWKKKWRPLMLKAMNFWNLGWIGTWWKVSYVYISERGSGRDRVSYIYLASCILNIGHGINKFRQDRSMMRRDSSWGSGTKKTLLAKQGCGETSRMTHFVDSGICCRLSACSNSVHTAGVRLIGVKVSWFWIFANSKSP